MLNQSYVERIETGKWVSRSWPLYRH